MNTLMDNYVSPKESWVSSVSESFSCENDETHLKTWELWTLMLCSFCKEILDFLVYTTSPKKGSWSNLFGGVFPLNLEMFWILLFKLGMCYVFLLYLNIKYKGTTTMWSVWVFWFLTVLFPFVNSLESKYSIMVGMSSMWSLVTYMLFFIYFFVVDPVHIDSLKMLFYDNLTMDEKTGSVHKNANSKISLPKLKHLALTTCVIILSAMALMFMVNSIMGAFQKIEGSKSSETVKPKNQEQLEKMYKSNPMLVLMSSMIMAPILEEWCFRSFILSEGKFKWWTILTSGFIFGLMHLNKDEGVMHMMPYIMPGIVFATTMYISQNMWHSMMAHSLFNTIVLMKMNSGV